MSKNLKQLIQVEFWENHYLDQMEFLLKQDLVKMMDGLRSKDKIKENWIDAFKRSAEINSDFARGAERIYFWLFNQFGTPNSSPIGADLFFETYNAFVHIDVKTAKIDNTSDYKGKIPVGKNQTSYKLKNKNYIVDLPKYYKYENKICFTYFISIVFGDSTEEFDIVSISLICVPNGLLTEVYGDSVYDASKIKGKGFRYKFNSSPYFKLLKGKPLRVRLLYLNEKFITNKKKILGF